MRKILLLCGLLFLIAGQATAQLGVGSKLNGYQVDRDEWRYPIHYSITIMGKPANLLSIETSPYTFTSTAHLVVEVDRSVSTTDTVTFTAGSWTSEDVAKHIGNQLKEIGVCAKSFTDTAGQKRVYMFVPGNSRTLRVLAHATGAETVLGFSTTAVNSVLPEVRIKLPASGMSVSISNEPEVDIRSAEDSITVVQADSWDTSVHMESSTIQLPVDIQGQNIILVVIPVDANGDTWAVSKLGRLHSVIFGLDSAGGTHALRVDANGRLSIYSETVTASINQSANTVVVSPNVNRCTSVHSTTSGTITLPTITGKRIVITSLSAYDDDETANSTVLVVGTYGAVETIFFQGITACGQDFDGHTTGSGDTAVIAVHNQGGTPNAYLNVEYFYK